MCRKSRSYHLKKIMGFFNTLFLLPITLFQPKIIQFKYLVVLFSIKTIMIDVGSKCLISVHKVDEHTVKEIIQYHLGVILLKSYYCYQVTNAEITCIHFIK